MINGVDVEKRYYSVCQICLRDFESFVVELGYFYSQEFINISLIDPCLYIGNGMIILTYVDDCIIVGPSIVNINRFIDSMKNGDKNFVLTNEGYINKFLGIEVTQLDDN